RNLSEIENENNNNMQRKNKMNHSDKTNESSKNSYNNETVTLENKPYNDISKNLTEKELYDVLNSLKECPPNEDLINIWSHTVGVGNEGFENINKSLKGFMEKHLDNDVYKNSVSSSVRKYIYKWIWERIIRRFYRTVATEEVEYTKNFYSLIKGDHTLDDILKFIYSFLQYFQILKKELHEKTQTELLHKMAILLNENH
ncbi:exported protein (PHISTa-like), partial [Plasmodium gaboni]